MSTTKNAVRVFIGGEEYTVRSEVPPEYTREVAAYLDAALKRVRDTLPMVESHKAAILAGLAITDELFQARRGDQQVAARISAMADDLARLRDERRRLPESRRSAQRARLPRPPHYGAARTVPRLLTATDSGMRARRKKTPKAQSVGRLARRSESLHEGGMRLPLAASLRPTGVRRESPINNSFRKGTPCDTS